MKRTVRYWGHYLAELLEMAAAIVVVLYLLTAVNATGDLLTDLLAALPALLTFATTIALLIGNLSAQMLYVPLQLSMNDTRRSCFAGFLLYRAAAIAVAGALSGLALLLSGEYGMGVGTLPALVLAMVILSASGSLMGLAWVKLKVLGIIVIILVCGGAGGVVGFLGASENGGAALVQILGSLRGVTGILAAVAAAVTALDLGLHWLSLRKQAVKL